MIIAKNINHKGRAFRAITDDTRIFVQPGRVDLSTLSPVDSVDLAQSERISLSPSEILCVRSKQNESYFTPSIKPDQIIESQDLHKVFMSGFEVQAPQIVGITGTNGKTTTAAMIYSLLLDCGYRVALLGTRGLFINDQCIKSKGLTTPCVLELYENLNLSMQHQCDFFIMEISSHAIIQERIAGLDFALRILTNITSDHLDYHGSVEEYRAIKNSFLAGGGIKILNADDPYAQCVDPEVFYYGIEKKGHLSVDAYALENGIDAHLSWWRRTDKGQEKEQCSLDTHLYGKHNLYNALAAITALKILTQKPLDSIALALNNFGGVSGRMEVVNTHPLVIVDFAHTHDGMQQIFESFNKQDISVVFGAGGDRDKTKRPKMGAMAQRYAQKIYLTSDNPRSENPSAIIEDILSGMQEAKQGQSIEVHEDRKKAITHALSSLEDNAVLLILGKGDEDYQIIGERKIYFDDREIVREYFNDK